MSKMTYKKINVYIYISIKSNRLLLFTTPKMIFYDFWRNEPFRYTAHGSPANTHMNTDDAYNPDKV